MIHHKVESCPKCGSINFTKKGFCNLKKDKKQRYLCNDCDYKFQLKEELPNWVQKAYTDYAIKGIVYKELTLKYNKSIPTITKYFDKLGEIKKQKYIDKVNNKEIPPIAIPISLILDATFFKRSSK